MDLLKKNATKENAAKAGNFAYNNIYNRYHLHHSGLHVDKFQKNKINSDMETVCYFDAEFLISHGSSYIYEMITHKINISIGFIFLFE